MDISVITLCNIVIVTITHYNYTNNDPVRRIWAFLLVIIINFYNPYVLINIIVNKDTQSHDPSKGPPRI